jgi:hypothetical protein
MGVAEKRRPEKRITRARRRASRSGRVLPHADDSHAGHTHFLTSSLADPACPVFTVPFPPFLASRRRTPPRSTPVSDVPLVRCLPVLDPRSRIRVR